MNVDVVQVRDELAVYVHGVRKVITKSLEPELLCSLLGCRYSFQQIDTFDVPDEWKKLNPSGFGRAADLPQELTVLEGWADAARKAKKARMIEQLKDQLSKLEAQ